MFSNNVQDNMVGKNNLSNNRREIILFNMLHQKSFCNFLMKKKRGENDLSKRIINSLSLADSGVYDIDRIINPNTGVIQSIHHNYSTESIYTTCRQKQQYKDAVSNPIRYFLNTDKISCFSQFPETTHEEAMKQGFQAWENKNEKKGKKKAFFN